MIQTQVKSGLLMSLKRCDQLERDRSDLLQDVSGKSKSGESDVLFVQIFSDFLVR